MKSPLILPMTLIVAGVLAFMATTGILPPTVFRLWPVIFVILGIVGLISLSSEELMSEGKKKTTSKPAAKPAAKASKPVAKKAASAKKAAPKKAAKKTSRKK
jgi:hypothetical protein